MTQSIIKKISSFWLFKTGEETIKKMSISEKLIFLALLALSLFATLLLIRDVYTKATTPVPERGGILREGVIGTPRFVNPLLAVTDTDRDLVMLTYSGLMRATPDGSLIPDLAESYSISKDNKEYTFTLKKDAVFHDGTPVNADDVLFTVEMSQNENLKSTKNADWSGVQVEKVDEKTVKFILKKPYSPFLENTTLGILPKHLWENISTQEFAFTKLNTKPVGSGPYIVDSITYNESGIPTQYTLVANKNFTLGEPFISKIVLTFYSNEDMLIKAWDTKIVDAIGGISPQNINKSPRNAILHRVSYPRIFAVFFNQSKAHIFADKSVRKALNTAIDKDAIINTVLGGYATKINSPIPPYIIDKRHREYATTTKHHTKLIENAKNILKDGGWDFDEETSTWKKGTQELVFSISTANTPELKLATDAVANTWRELGIVVKVNIFETGSLNKNIIRARDYEALLFGEVVGRSLDLYSFWHSSQREDPGLNIAMYANAKLDKLLEEARATSSQEKKKELYKKIEKNITENIGAIFLYSPDFLYATADFIKGIDLQLISVQSERFINVYKWYTETNRVWNFLIK